MAATSAEWERIEQDRIANEDARETIQPATDEESFRSGLQRYYRRARQDVMDHLRDVFEFAKWFDAYAESLQDHANPLACPTGRRAKTGLSAIVDEMREAGTIGWKYSTVRTYRSLAAFEWEVIARCGSLKKALEFVSNYNRTPTQRTERKEQKARMRTKQSDMQKEIDLLARENDVQAKVISDLRERVRVLQLAADTAKVEELEERVANHAKAETMAYRKVDAAEAMVHTMDRKLERQGRELGSLRAALASRPRNGQGNGNGNSHSNGQTDVLPPSLRIGQPAGGYVDPGEQ